MNALTKAKNLKNKIPKKGTNEFEIFMYFVQILEGAATAFVTRAGVNLASRDKMIKEIVNWGLSLIFLLMAIFIKHPVSFHIKAIAFGIFMEAMNRTFMKRIEKTDFGMKYLSGDEVPISEKEMDAIVERRVAEERALAEARTMQGTPEDEDVIEPVQGLGDSYIDGEDDDDSLQGEDDDYMEGEETEVHENIIPMRI